VTSAFGGQDLGYQTTEDNRIIHTIQPFDAKVGAVHRMCYHPIWLPW
jgi:hypothetical protein